MLRSSLSRSGKRADQRNEWERKVKKNPPRDCHPPRDQRRKRGRASIKYPLIEFSRIWSVLSSKTLSGVRYARRKAQGIQEKAPGDAKTDAKTSLGAEKSEGEGEMKAKTQRLLLPVGIVAVLVALGFFIYGAYWVAKAVSYRVFYEDMVKKTITEVVKPEALK